MLQSFVLARCLVLRLPCARLRLSRLSKSLFSFILGFLKLLAQTLSSISAGSNLLLELRALELESQACAPAKYASTTKAVAVLLRNRSCRNPARTQLAPAHLHAS